MSLLTNTSALAALQNIAITQRALSATQNQVSTGLRVQTASDSSALWSIASTLRSDSGALSAVSEAMSLGASVLNVAATAISSAVDAMNRIKADLVTALQPGTSTAAVQTDIAAQQRSIVAVLGSAAFNGVNLLDGTSNASTTFLTSFVRSTSGTTATGAVSASTAWSLSSPYNPGSTSGSGLGGLSGVLSSPLLSALYNVSAAAQGPGSSGQGAQNYSGQSLLGFDITGASAKDIRSIGVAMDAALSVVATIGTQVATAQTTISNQQTFVAALSNALTSGIGSLVDADMNVASTRLQALQTQQQLGIQALSIANGNSQLILKLFASL